MDAFLINLLVDEAKLDHKVDKSFKNVALAAKEVSLKFDLTCNVVNVENRMKTIKKNFKELRKIESHNSGMSWDDTQKMWKFSKDVYRDYIPTHPKAKKFLNKPIFKYEELCIVCGDDQATGSFAKSSGDDIIDVDEASEIGLEDITQCINNTQVNITLISPYMRKHGKRVRAMDEFGEKMDKLAEKIGDVAAAMKSSKSQNNTAYLYAEVMKSEGFDELLLEEVPNRPSE